MKLSQLSCNRDQIFNLYEKTDSDIKEDLSILREWMKKQPHLPSDALSDNFLEVSLLKNKFSVEKTKSKIENYCTIKGSVRYQYLFEYSPKPSKEPMFYTALPNLTDDFHRIILAKLRNKEEYNMLKDVSSGFHVREILSRYDYNDGEIVILDLTVASPSEISKFRINVFADMLNVLLKGHCARIKQGHIINSVVKLVLPAVIPLLPSKLGSKLVHENYESLRKFVPVTHLPKDYGGNLKSLDDILADWDKIHEENEELLKKYINTKSIEELRIEKSGTEEMKGTFKQLNID